MQFKDYYQTLGVARDASADDIKKAYRKLARKYHPDVSKEADAESRFKELGEAYEVLKDPEKRTAYDQFGKDWKAGQDFRPPPGWDAGFEFRGPGAGAGGNFGGDGFSDFFESLFGQKFSGGAQPGFRGGFGGARNTRRKGEDHHAKVMVSLEDAYTGATRQISLRLPHSDASGRVAAQERTLNVKIPAGVTEGQRIRLGGQGAPSMNGGAAGDLYLEIAFKPNPRFRAEGRDIYHELPVTPWEAALGQKVPVPTLGGELSLKLPEGAQSGQKLRLKAKGLPGTTPGDQYVILKMVTPPADNPTKRKIYEHMAEAMSFDPRAS
ncbi:MAG: DnaJ domain-containing protein [Gammaproteobacteria bacterium]|nr:DnaJ domain-containing protein [Gammaproteobacteria bacterium]MCP5136456.1 DnaJ domain-containing protein [Gammaproteobacteria bacterium]